MSLRSGEASDHGMDTIWWFCVKAGDYPVGNGILLDIKHEPFTKENN